MTEMEHRFTEMEVSVKSHGSKRVTAARLAEREEQFRRGIRTRLEQQLRTRSEADEKPD